MKETSVGLAEFAMSRNPEEVLVAYGLGSCVGVVMTDPVSRLCGLLHAVLPRAGDGSTAGEVNPHKYVESGIDKMLGALKRAGADPARLVVRIVGGSNMVLLSDSAHPFDIGNRNIEAAQSTLKRLKMPIATAEVGGHTGRTVRVYVAENRVTVRVIGGREREI
jgi:chemotaxis protein CheD